MEKAPYEIDQPLSSLLWGLHRWQWRMKISSDHLDTGFSLTQEHSALMSSEVPAYGWNKKALWEHSLQAETWKGGWIEGEHSLPAETQKGGRTKSWWHCLLKWSLAAEPVTVGKP